MIAVPTPPPPAPSGPGRREANRAATLAAIKAAALRQIAEQGAPALSVRGVARDIGLSPAGMYRYYDGRDALLTDLLVDAYNDLADAVTTAAGLPLPDDPRMAQPRDVNPDAPSIRDPIGALRAAIAAYRRWALDNPTRFLLLFGTPVPGYAAPPEGPTVTANRRMGQAFFTLAALAWREGLLSGSPTSAAPERTTPQEAELLAQLRALAPGFPADLIPQMLAGWALWHGLVTLELTGQLHWIYPDANHYFSGRIDAWIEHFGRGS